MITRKKSGKATPGRAQPSPCRSAWKNCAANRASRKVSPNTPNCTAVYTYWLCGLSVNGIWLENFQLTRA